MGIAATALRLLWPKGSPHSLAGHGEPLLLALGDILDDLRDRVRLIISESRPDEALHTLPEWHAALGRRYDPLLPVETQRLRLTATLYARGGATRNDLQAQIAKEFTGVTISEISATSETGAAECGVEECGASEGDIASNVYLVTGALDDDAQAARLAAILQHFSALHLAPFNNLIIRSDAGSSETGVATCGLEECGA